MVKGLKNFILGFLSRILALIAGYVVMLLAILLKARYSGFQGHVGIDPVSFVCKPWGLVEVLLVFAVGFWLAIQKTTRPKT